MHGPLMSSLVYTCALLVGACHRLENVRARYFAKQIYTLTGSILLAVNPFERLPIYSEGLMAPYKGVALGKAP